MHLFIVFYNIQSDLQHKEIVAYTEDKAKEEVTRLYGTLNGFVIVKVEKV